MRRFAVILFASLSSLALRADSLRVDSAGAGKVAYGNLGTTYPILQNLGKYSVMIWFKADAFTNTAVIFNRGATIKALTMTGTDGALDFLDNTHYTTNASFLVTGLWKCIGYTFNNGAPNTTKVIFYAGTSTSSIAQMTGNALNDNAALKDDSSDGWTLGKFSAPAGIGSYGTAMISTGIWTLRDFQEQQFSPHVTSSTLLLSTLQGTGSAPLAYDYSGNGQNSTQINMLPSSDGPPIYIPDSVGW